MVVKKALWHYDNDDDLRIWGKKVLSNLQLANAGGREITIQDMMRETAEGLDGSSDEESDSDEDSDEDGSEGSGSVTSSSEGDETATEAGTSVAEETRETTAS